MTADPEDFSLLAGIYVLGALETSEARSVEELAARDADVAHAVEIWQNRLAPLADAAPPSPVPPAVWRRLEATLGLTPAREDRARAAAAAAAAMPVRSGIWHRWWRSLSVWRGATGVFAALTALATLLLLAEPEPTLLATTLAPAGGPAPVFLAEVRTDGSLMVRPLSAVQVPPGKDLELWTLPDGVPKPISLGVLPPIGRTIGRARLPHLPLQLLVSLEPAGGSPTGAPTGPALFSGMLKRS